MKLLIINNGLKNLRGHYYETGVSVAEAAARAGLEPVLVAHASCPADLTGPGLPVLPLCRTDHWMGEPPAARADDARIRCDLAAIARTPIERVASGEVDFHDYLLARYEPPKLPVEPPPLALRSRVKRAMKPFVPPVVARVGRFVFTRRRVPLTLTRKLARQLAPPFVRNLFRQVPPVAMGEIAPPSDPLLDRLTRAGQAFEFDHATAFQHDLERAIGLTGVGPDDHVFLPTAHGRELAAVTRLAAALGPTRCPTFHLEFRHALDFDGRWDYDPIDPHEAHWLYRYTANHRVYFDWCRRRPPDPRVRAYTDTAELTDAYAAFSGLPFGTLPIPFRAERIADRPRSAGAPICLAYLGDVRDEKGFPWLPSLVDALRPEAEAGAVRFLFQASLGDRPTNPLSVIAIEELRQRNLPYLDLPGIDGPLGPDRYYELLSEADVVLCPYSPETYLRRSSGTLTEGIAAGVPTVVPEGTWLASQQPTGTGTRFTDLPSFVAAVRELVADYTAFAARARAYRDRWRASHNPESLIRALVSGGGPSDRLPAAA